MKVLVLWANESQPNLGVRALALGTRALVEKAFPGADVRIRGFGAEGDGPMNIGHLAPLFKEWFVRQRGLMEWLSSFDLIVDTRAGDSFADIYGIKRLVKMSVISEFAHKARVPVVLGPQTVGPFNTVRGQLLARRVLRTSSLVITRDPVSAEACVRLGRQADVIATDVAFVLPQPDVPRNRDVILNVSGLLWDPNPHVDAARYRESLYRIVRNLETDGRRISLLAHVLGDGVSGDSDRHAIEALVRNLDSDYEVILPSGLSEVRNAVASARLVIGARMHACLNALSVGTPTIPMAYSRKFAPLFDSIGWRQTVAISEFDLVEKVRFKASLDEELKSEAKASLHIAKSLIENASSALRRSF